MKLLIAVVAALLAGCGSPSEPEPALEGAATAVEFHLGRHRLGIYPVFFVKSRDGFLLVGGALRTPCAPYEASAQAAVNGNTVTLLVTGENVGDCPTDMVTEVFYDASIPGLSSGTYQVRLLHEWKDTAWAPVTAFLGEAVVR